MRNIELVNAVNILSKYVDKKLPQKISYAITKNATTLSSEYSVYEKELQKIFDAYKDHIEKDDNEDYKYGSNGVPVVDEEISEEFNSRIAELLEFEIDINLYKIDESVFDFEDNDRYDSMSANDIIILQSVLC